jgi:DNA primase
MPGGKFNLESPEGKEGFVREITPILKEVRGDIRRSEYIRVISERFRIPEDLLRKEVEKKRVRKKGIDMDPVQSRTVLLPEERLLAHLFSNPQFISLCRDEFSFRNEDMDSDIYKIFVNLLRIDTEGLEVINSGVLSLVSENDDMLKKAIDLSMLEGLPPCNEEEIRTILREIEKRSILRRLPILREKVNVKLADGTLRSDDADHLEHQDLMKKLKVLSGSDSIKK